MARGVGRLAGHYFRVFGARIFWPFALISALVVFLLATVNIASHAALRRYVDDQVKRLPWDVSVYQTAEVPLADSVFKDVARTTGISAAQRLYFLRTVPPFTTLSLVDGTPLRTPWLSVLTATDNSLIPPDLRPTGDGAVLVLVGAKQRVGAAFLELQGRHLYQLVVHPYDEYSDPHGLPYETAGVQRLPTAKTGDIEFNLPDEADPDHSDNADQSQPADHDHAAVDHDHAAPDHDHTADSEHSHSNPDTIISKNIERIIRVDATEINRWFMEETSSPTLVPEIGIILVTKFDPLLINAFDQVSRGFVHAHEDADIHGEPGEYFADVLHLLRLSRNDILSGWDLAGSQERVTAIGNSIAKSVRGDTLAAAIDNTIGVLITHMNVIARRVTLLSFLVSIPLIVMAGVLLGNVSTLLTLNVRRTLGLLRLRGASGSSIGAAVLLAIGGGGLMGGLVGALLGTALPIYFYVGGWLPWPIVFEIQPPLYLLLIVAIGVLLSLLMGWRLVRYAATISPLEASGRVARSEVESANVRFGPLHALALLLGGLKVVGWAAGIGAFDLWSQPWVQDADRILDFIAFPLFVFGLTSFVASRRWVISALTAPVVWLTAGPLRQPLRQHLETRRHRAASLLLIVGLMTSLVLYPTIMMAVFNDKTERGALAQLGGDLHLTLDALNFMPAENQSRGDLGARFAALKQRLDPMIGKLKSLKEVDDASYIVEGLVEGLYMPDRGFSGIPLYLIDNPRAHLDATYYEAAMGKTEPFAGLITRLSQGQVILSEAMADFYKRKVGGPMPVGRTVTGALQTVSYGGAMRFLPASPMRTVNDRDGLVSARLDYLNSLFGSSPYLVARGGDPALSSLDVLMPRIVVALKAAEGVTPARLRSAVLAALPVQPLEVRDRDLEVSRLGSDMYIFLARQNVQIYLLGGLALTFIGIFAVAYANYTEDRRTLALLRIRGGGPGHVMRFFVPGILAPSVLGLFLGAGVATAVGFGITKVIWELRALQTVMSYLSTRLVISAQTVLIGLLLIVLVCGVALFFGRWVMRHTLRQGLSDN